MEDCPQFNGTLDFFFSPEENLNLIGHYFPDFDFKNKVVLDAGCRNGGITKAFHDLGAKTIGIDINNLAIEKAKIAHKGIEFHQESIMNLEKFKKNTFDIVFCSGTLPYLKPDQVEKAISEFKRVLKLEGKILLAFQKEKSFIFTHLVRIYNFLPKLFSPFLVFTAILYFKTLNFGYIRYALGEGLVGIHFGYPPELLKFEVPTPNCRMISSKYSVSFLWKKL